MDLNILSTKSLEYLKLYYKKNHITMQDLYNQNKSKSKYYIDIEIEYLVTNNLIMNSDPYKDVLNGVSSLDCFEITPYGRAYYEAILNQQELLQESKNRSLIALITSIVSVVVAIISIIINHNHP